MRDVLLYSVLRLALFGLVWWLLALAGFGIYMAGIIAALIAMLISILFLRRPREQAARRWQEADERRREQKARTRDRDADEEDELLDDAGTRDDDSESGGASGRVPDREAEQQQD